MSKLYIFDPGPPEQEGGAKGASSPPRAKLADNVPFFSKSPSNVPFFENISYEIVETQ